MPFTSCDEGRRSRPDLGDGRGRLQQRRFRQRATAPPAPATSAAGASAADDRRGDARPTPTWCRRATTRRSPRPRSCNERLKAFVAAPSAETLEAAKAQWLAARDDYGPTEAFRFYDGPIDDPDDRARGPDQRLADGRGLRRLRHRQPRRPASSTTRPPTRRSRPTCWWRATRRAARPTSPPAGTPSSSCCGARTRTPTGPGNRPFTDYTTAPNAERRGHLPRPLLGDLLVDDLTAVARAVGTRRPATTARRSSPIPTRRSPISSGASAPCSAGELAGERMGVAYETKDQEDEHSCFSDNTDADVCNNALGVAARRTWPSSRA